jgi:hypothetical protein
LSNVKGSKVGPQLPRHNRPRPGYVGSVAICAANGFVVGDVIVSERWKLRRRIMCIRPMHGTVITADAARPNFSRDEAERWPDDVRKAE